MSDENVMDLLDSLETKPSKSKPKKASTKRKENKSSGDDILGLLDELNVNDKPITPSEQSATGTVGSLGSLGTTGADTAETAKEAPTETANETAKEDPSNVPQQDGGDLEDLDDPAEENLIDPLSQISSWWSNKNELWNKAHGKLNSAVNDAVKQAKQAEQKVREEQSGFNFFGLQSKITSVLNSIVPPISRHEQLKIHVFHDMVGYPVVDKTIYEVFDYVMEQVEGGGELNMVIQKGKERHMASAGSHKRLNAVECTLEDGRKLAKANIEEVLSKQKSQQPPNSSNNDDDNLNIKVSELYVSVQPVCINGEVSSFISANQSSLFFVVYLCDFEHDIEISTVSQSFPIEWKTWLDSENLFEDSIIDPRDWISGWIEDGVSLAAGVVAQKYVTTRMNI